ncbi:alpha/beta fold hydrolase [Bdellovibrio sp. NC01]|uniref:alpha/beta fold hydrolase n=1 Tax=Bdellovibrio sp. NC01 TaxID=2220073 RepID=UPI0011599C3C|nr:alpha/beta hydrolase [Bdellovibrio sp. NC01]QDK36708.1 alpha/beta hydrolase [Bdellovibrio sp. NC01]
MNTFKAKDGATLYYKDWGKGQPIVFSHGWPLSSDAWEDQMMFLASSGYRVIAHDRRGHGRSEQTWEGNNMDQYADDLATLIETLNLQDAILVGHSTGGGEVARYIGRHGTNRVAGAVLVGAVTPLMLKTEDNPKGVPMEVFDGIREGVQKDRAQLFKDFPEKFYGANRLLKSVSEGVKESFYLQGMQGSLKAHYDCVKQFSETDFRDDLRKFDMPTLVLHGDDDQIVPIEVTAKRVPEFVKQAELIIVKGGSHGMPTTHKDEINKELLSFAQKNAKRTVSRAQDRTM